MWLYVRLQNSHKVTLSPISSEVYLQMIENLPPKHLYCMCIIVLFLLCLIILNLYCEHVIFARTNDCLCPSKFTKFFPQSATNSGFLGKRVLFVLECINMFLAVTVN